MGGGVGPVDAISGEKGCPKGWNVVMPLGRLLLGNDSQLKLNGGAVSVPEAKTVKLICGAWVIVIVPPDAVKGPTVVGDDGTDNVRPDAGTGDGMGALKLIAAGVMEAGVAPVA